MGNQKNNYKRGFLVEIEFVQERISRSFEKIPLKLRSKYPRKKGLFIYYGEYSTESEDGKKQLMVFSSPRLKDVKEFIKSKPAFYKYGR